MSAVTDLFCEVECILFLGGEVVYIVGFLEVGLEWTVCFVALGA